MDRLNDYRRIIRQVLAEYARYKPANGQIDTELVVDAEHDHFELLHVGWDGVQRVHGPVIHIDIIGDKVWIQYDGTNRPVADELMAAGIPQHDIVLAWHPRELRHHTGFAVG
ncbi:MAG TPA: XisI protein [Gemmataceae bacterium]|nr:XisI protein [Gemmataceae bacterium]